MECLHCGDCCKRISPLSAPEPCPKMVQREGNYFMCSDYKNRPEECKNHRHPFRFCPIGLSELGLDNLDVAQNYKIIQRIENGFEIGKRIN